MTEEEIIEMAIDSGFPISKKEDPINLPQFFYFAKLIAEKEREECAKLCEKLVLEDDSFYGEFSGGKDCAKAIRARGQE